MNAFRHTSRMLQGWGQAGITQVDLALRRPTGAMIWHRRRPLANLPLAWARAENVRQADVFIRPARGHSWPLLFLDDVDMIMAQRIAGKYAAMIVHTSPNGGCHIWLRLTQSLNESQRAQAQRWLIQRINADPGSASGEHLGRLAGTRNWKRQGVWVNFITPSQLSSIPWNPSPALQPDPSPIHTLSSPSSSFRSFSSGIDRSESAREWGWVCGSLKAGIHPDAIYRQLVERATPRRGRDASRYARYTLKRAIRHSLDFSTP